MESYQLKNVHFTYPGRDKKALNDISLTVRRGEFITLCGKSGCGKTTLLRMLKPALTPHGTLQGSIIFEGKNISEADDAALAAKIGFVLQDPDNQIVTDKVWHELAFGLESLGCPIGEIRTRVAEMASYFGIQGWFHKSVNTLSGGQKQLLNLASVMVMQPSVLILDEPTAQLDPIAAQNFISTLHKINRELGTTVILSEHRLEEAFPVSDRVLVMDEGRIIADDTPTRIGATLCAQNHDMALALPTPMRICHALEKSEDAPLTVREGRTWFEDYAKKNPPMPDAILPETDPTGEIVLSLRDAWFRYEKDAPDILKGCSLDIHRGELFAIVGGNGAGKTTLLSVLGSLMPPYRGKLSQSGTLAMLPQQPQALFVKKTIRLDLADMLTTQKCTADEKETRLMQVAQLCRITHLLNCHPFDLSGGELQRAALAKVLLLQPQILLLDEPTKGMDAHFKQIFAGILSDLCNRGITVVLVSHDIEFCAEHATRCALMFDGALTTTDTPRAFFAGKHFYTTATHRMVSAILPNAVRISDVYCAYGLTEAAPQQPEPPAPPTDTPKAPHKARPSKARIAGGILFSLLFLVCAVLYACKLPLPYSSDSSTVLQIATALCTIGALLCFFKQKTLGADIEPAFENKQKLTKRTLVAAGLILIAVPLTIYVGTVYFGDRKYYFISLLIILETLLPFGMVFESRKPQARELIIISVLCAIAVAGRAAFFMLPQFKPVVAVVIISGICFGGETGFLVGAMTGFVSNFLFGQGPWAPWQMFAFGIIGFLAGILFRKGRLRKTRFSLSLFGALTTFFIYGGILNPASVILAQPNPTWEMILTAYATGVPFDLIHAGATAFFLWCMAESMIEKLERTKLKYGLLR